MAIYNFKWHTCFNYFVFFFLKPVYIKFKFSSPFKVSIHIYLQMTPGFHSMSFDKCYACIYLLDIIPPSMFVAMPSVVHAYIY